MAFELYKEDFDNKFKKRMVTPRTLTTDVPRVSYWTKTELFDIEECKMKRVN